MTTRASGTFDVNVAPLPTHDTTEGSPLGRMSIDKRFRGDLEATSVGETLTAGTAMKGSAGYVAIERVSGTLAIAIADGTHAYDFDYAIGEVP